MNPEEREIRKIRMAKAVEFLKEFLPEEEREEYYLGYTYSEILGAISLAVAVEKNRIREK